MGRKRRVPENADAPRARQNLVEEFQILCAHLCNEERDAGNVASRPRKAFHMSNRERIGMDGENDWDGPRYGQSCVDLGGIGRIDQIDTHFHELSRVLRVQLRTRPGPPPLDSNRLPLDPTVLAQPVGYGLRGCRECGPEHADAGNLPLACANASAGFRRIPVAAPSAKALRLII